MQPVEFKTFRTPGTDPGPRSARVQVAGGDFAAATTLAEWADDRIARLPAGLPAGGILITILNAARSGPAEAAAAARMATALDEVDQLAVWSALGDMTGQVVSLPEAVQCLAGIRAEWKRLGLAGTPGNGTRRA